MTGKRLAGVDLQIPPIRTYYARIVTFGLDTAWGRRAQPRAWHPEHGGKSA